ncbi:hypothetical protein H920_06315 [Fukomys damarensis]|uniref:Uncharacterized protein n=1 Tax=Fukomys damarensis TaxID=885580 RepID=A0A091DMD3_FUKDA|nr:hypothetical protein H920_06315 [Fukomys damarensis]
MRVSSRPARELPACAGSRPARQQTRKVPKTPDGISSDACLPARLRSPGGMRGSSRPVQQQTRKEDTENSEDLKLQDENI